MAFWVGVALWVVMALWMVMALWVGVVGAKHPPGHYPQNRPEPSCLTAPMKQAFWMLCPYLPEPMRGLWPPSFKISNPPLPVPSTGDGESPGNPSGNAIITNGSSAPNVNGRTYVGTSNRTRHAGRRIIGIPRTTETHCPVAGMGSQNFASGAGYKGRPMPGTDQPPAYG